MKIQTGIKLKNFDGVVMKDVGGKETTSGKLMAEALLSPVDPKRQLTGIQKYERGAIAERLYHANHELDVTIEEAKMIKDAIGEAYTPLGVKRLWDLIEDKKPKKEKK